MGEPWRQVWRMVAAVESMQEVCDWPLSEWRGTMERIVGIVSVQRRSIDFETWGGGGRWRGSELSYLPDSKGAARTVA